APVPDLRDCGRALDRGLGAPIRLEALPDPVAADSRGEAPAVVRPGAPALEPGDQSACARARASLTRHGRLGGLHGARGNPRPTPTRGSSAAGWRRGSGGRAPGAGAPDPPPRSSSAPRQL